MADLKISQLGSIVTVVPATDVLPVVQGGTTYKVTPNQLLGAGGTATLASATITGAATVGTTLGVTGAISGASLALSGAGAGFTVIATSGNALNQIERSTNIQLAGFQLRTLATNDWYFGLRETADSDFHLFSYGLSADVVKIARATGNVTISTGNVVIGTAAKGIDFTTSADGSGTVTAELLNDYEEGTWTPVLGGSSSTSGQTYTTQAGRYTKIGRQVICTFEVQLLTVGTIVGNPVIAGLPFTSTGTGLTLDGGALVSSFAVNFASSLQSVCGYITATSTQVLLTGNKTAGTNPVINLLIADIANTTRIAGTITYFA